MDDALLVSMLDGLADGAEQFEPLVGSELVPIAVLRDGSPADQFHDEVGPARLCGPPVEDPGDTRVVHQGQGLPLNLETRHDLLGVHARLDDLQGDLPPNRLFLQGHKDRAHPSLADLLMELVRADIRAGTFGDGLVDGGGRFSMSLQEAAGLFVRAQQSLNPVAKPDVLPACLLKVGCSFTRIR
jgi:hypothetical protein